MLDKLNDLVNELKQTSSSNEKKDILLKIDDDVKSLLKYVYCDFIQFHVTSTNLIKRQDLIEDNNLSIVELFDKLNNLEITGHKAISIVNGFISNNNEYKELIYNMIDKNLKVRIDAKLINNVFPGLIPTFEVALAYDYEEKKKHVDFNKQRWMSSRKMDGCVNYDTIVEFENGKKIKIGEVVENKIKGKIKSYNINTKKIEYKSINNWMKNIFDINDNNQEWYEIELENNEKITLTGNHRVWVDNLNCWRRVDNLDGTEILIFD